MRAKEMTAGSVLAPLLAVIVFAVLLQFITRFHAMEDSDYLLISIMSYTRPTLYYWGQDQYLNLVPFLFSFLHDPETNLVAITAFHLIALLQMGAVAGAIAIPREHWLFWTLSIGFLSFLNGRFWYDACYQPYAMALFTLLLGMSLFRAADTAPKRTWRWILTAASAALALIAVQVAQPVIVPAVCWVIFLGTKESRTGNEDRATGHWRRRSDAVSRIGLWVFFFAAFAALFLVGQRAVFAHSRPAHRLIQVVPRQAIAALFILWRNFRAHYAIPAKLSLLLIGVQVAGYAVAIYARRLSVIFRSVALFLLPALLMALGMASLDWVANSQFHPRYLFPSIFLIKMNTAYLVCEAKQLWRAPRWVSSLASASLLTAALIAISLSLGLSPLESVRRRIAETFPIEPLAAAADDLDGVAGDYWKVWPAVWLLNAYGRQEVLGVTLRGDSILDLLKARAHAKGHLRLAGYRGDDQVNNWIHASFPLMPVGSVQEKRGFVFVEISEPGNLGAPGAATPP